MEYIFENQRHLETRLQYWQDILRLSDWIITAEVVPAHQMADAVGRNRQNFRSKRSHIQLCDMASWDSGLIEPERDMEADLLHELLHLHVTPNDGNQNTCEYDLKEQAIECLTTALLRLEREKP